MKDGIKRTDLREVVSQTGGMRSVIGALFACLMLPLLAVDNTDLVRAARAQIGVTTSYVPDYRRIPYPNGDVPRNGGVCVDVVIRALRDARKVDLQRLVHEDMAAHFKKYPQNWGLSKTDTNIDHRRVPNLQCFFKRQGWSLPVTKVAADYQPGDLVTCLVVIERPGRKPLQLPHIMVVSDQKTKTGVPLVIHNIGRGTEESDTLFTYPLTGHYRMVPSSGSQSASRP